MKLSKLTLHSSDHDKLQMLINQDKTDINYQFKREKFILYCLCNEFKHYHRQKFLLSTMFQEFVKSKIIYIYGRNWIKISSQCQH